MIKGIITDIGWGLSLYILNKVAVKTHQNDYYLVLKLILKKKVMMYFNDVFMIFNIGPLKESRKKMHRQSNNFDVNKEHYTCDVDSAW